MSSAATPHATPTVCGKRAAEDTIELPVPIHESLSDYPQIRTALALPQDSPKNVGASMHRRQSETLSLIAGCMEQCDKLKLINFLLDAKGFATCPPPGVSFSTSLLPVAHTLIHNYDLWDDKKEVRAPDASSYQCAFYLMPVRMCVRVQWASIFEKVAEHADLNQPWGEAQETPNDLYFIKFGQAF